MKSAIRVSEHGHGEVSRSSTMTNPKRCPFKVAAVLNDGRILRGRAAASRSRFSSTKCSAGLAHCPSGDVVTLLTRRPAVAEVELCALAADLALWLSTGAGQLRRVKKSAGAIGLPSRPLYDKTVELGIWSEKSGACDSCSLL